MTRKSRRELERVIDRLESDGVDVTAAHTLVVPSNAIPEEERRPKPDVSADAVTVVDEETGELTHVVPLHSEPAATDGVPMTTDRELRSLWSELSDEQRDHERRLRETYDLPIPPLLNTDT